MPNRILRDGILRSKKIASLPPMAELFFRRLMSVADDFGRYYADPDLLLSDCFPIRPSWADREAVCNWLERCRTSGLIQTYMVNNTDFLEIEAFGQRVKPGQSSKFPDLPGLSGKSRENPASRAPSSPSSSSTTPPNSNFSFEESFERIYAAHPKKDGKILAQQALAGACDGAEDVPAVLKRVELAHALWLPEFKRAGKFCPQLHRWISDQKYLDDPPAPTEEEYDWRKAARG